MHTNYLVLIGFAFVGAVVFVFMLCETLMRLERRKAVNKSIHYKPSLREKQVGFGKTAAPPGGAAGAAGYMLLPVHKSHPDEIVVQGENQDEVHKVAEDPRSGEAWQRQDSAGGYADRKEDPWISKNGTAVLSGPTAVKPIPEEPKVEKSGPGNTGIADVAAVAATVAVTDAAAQSTVVASVEPPPYPPESTFSTAGFWEAREAAKEASKNDSYFGGGGGSDTGGGFGSSGTGGYGSGGDGSSSFGWVGGDSSMLASEKQGWGQDSSEL